MAYTAKVDKSLCVSVATCVATAMNTFELGADGLAQIKKQNGDSDEVVLQAAQSCPVSAISVFDEKGKKIYPKE